MQFSLVGSTTPWQDIDDRLLNKGLVLCVAPGRCFRDMCSADFVLNMSHTVCLGLAQARGVTVGTEEVSALARRLRPLFEWSEHVGGSVLPKTLRKRRDQEGAMALLSKCDGATDLGGLLLQIQARLPPEVIDLIMEDVYGLIHQLALCSSTIHCIACYPSILHAANLWQEKETQISSQISKLGVNTIEIFGETYITSVGASGAVLYEQEVIVDEARELYGVQIGYGTRGVSALRVLYGHGPPSLWLGDGPAVRTANRLEMNELHSLKVIDDVSLFQAGSVLSLLTLSNETD